MPEPSVGSLLFYGALGLVGIAARRRISGAARTQRVADGRSLPFQSAPSGKSRRASPLLRADLAFQFGRTGATRTACVERTGMHFV